MRELVDLRAVALGIGAFFLGFAFFGVAGSFFLFPRTPTESLAADCVSIALALLPVLAGYLSAYKARQRPLLSGILAGALGTLLAVATVLVLFQGPMHWFLIAPVAAGVILASIGALAGRYRARHRA